MRKGWIRLRITFWNWAHKKSERLWHWIYYKKLLPLIGPPDICVQKNLEYSYRVEFVNSKEVK